MKKNVLVSIITVCYNSQKTIAATIESVLHQTYDHIEYIIIDGKSSDCTMEIVQKYERLFQGRMKVVSEPDNGIYDAMNKGIKLANGELIGIINSDDYYEPTAVIQMVEAMSEDKYQILYGFMRTLSNGQECSISRASHQMLERNMIGHPACFVTKAVYDDLGGFDTQYVSAADYDFMLRMKKSGQVKFIPVDALIANFALGGMCASAQAWPDLLKMKRNHNMISEREYRVYMWKDKIYKLLHRK